MTTAIRPQPWYDPRYAIPLAGIVLGSVLNAGSLTLDVLLGDARRERSSIVFLLVGHHYAQPQVARNVIDSIFFLACSRPLCIL